MPVRALMFAVASSVPLVSITDSSVGPEALTRLSSARRSVSPSSGSEPRSVATSRSWFLTSRVRVSRNSWPSWSESASAASTWTSNQLSMVLVRNQAEKKYTIIAGGRDNIRKFLTQRAASRAPGSSARTRRRRVIKRWPIVHRRTTRTSAVTISTQI